MLKAYDGLPSKPHVLYQNVPIDLGGEKVHIDIIVIDDPLDYNILIGHNFMYAMKFVESLVFQLLMIPLYGKVVTIDQINFYKPRASEALENILPHISGRTLQTPRRNGCPTIFKDSSILGIYEGPSPTIPLDYTPFVCTFSTETEIMIVGDARSENTSPTSSPNIDDHTMPDPIQVHFLFSFS